MQPHVLLRFEFEHGLWPLSRGSSLIALSHTHRGTEAHTHTHTQICKMKTDNDNNKTTFSIIKSAGLVRGQAIVERSGRGPSSYLHSMP